MEIPSLSVHLPLPLHCSPCNKRYPELAVAAVAPVMLLLGVFSECGPASPSQSPEVRDICFFLLATAVSGQDIWAVQQQTGDTGPAATSTSRPAAAGGAAGGSAVGVDLPARVWQGLDVVQVPVTEQLLQQAWQVAQMISAGTTIGQQETLELEKVRSKVKDCALPLFCIGVATVLEE